MAKKIIPVDVHGVEIEVGDIVESKQPGQEYVAEVVGLNGTSAFVTHPYISVLRDGVPWRCRVTYKGVSTADGMWDNTSYLEIQKKGKTLGLGAINPGAMTIPYMNGITNGTPLGLSQIQAAYQALGVATGIPLEESSEIKETKPENVEVKVEVKEDALDGLIIADDIKKEIISVLKQHQNQATIFDTWGLGDVIEYGRGMTFLFWGTPGTGKTWAATLMAKALSKELLVITAAEIQSSEPGAAQRNIQQAFKTATKEGKVILLDECDSLIFDRKHLGMVLAAEVNTLLTEIEKFEGVCILATNQVNRMDEALERRISLIVEFPKPNFEARKQIWKRMLPPKLPLADDVSHETLAKHELTGGLIKNVVLNAARMTSANGDEKVTAETFEKAVKRAKASKGLMGKMSGQQATMGQDVGVGVNTSKTAVDDFFKKPSQDKL